MRLPIFSVEIALKKWVSTVGFHGQLMMEGIKPIQT